MVSRAGACLIAASSPRIGEAPGGIGEVQRHPFQRPVGPLVVGAGHGDLTRGAAADLVALACQLGPGRRVDHPADAAAG